MAGGAASISLPERHIHSNMIFEYVIFRDSADTFQLEPSHKISFLSIFRTQISKIEIIHQPIASAHDFMKCTTHTHSNMFDMNHQQQISTIIP